MGRRTCAAAVAVGLAVAALSGSGLLAAVGDSATSSGNQITSGTFDEAPATELQVAQTSGRCRTAEYGDGPTAAMELSSETFDLSGSGTDQATWFCLRNVGETDGALAASFEAVSDVEVGACETSEADAGDTTCLDGDPGELASIVGVEIVVDDSSCTSLSSTFVDLHAAPGSLGTVLAGDSCRIAFRLRPLGDDVQHRQAQTDRLTWDIRFHLEPVS